MAKIRTITDINFGKGIIIPKESFISVREELAVYLCNEDENKNKRTQHSVRTGTFSLDNLTKEHLDYTYL